MEKQIQISGLNDALPASATQPKTITKQPKIIGKLNARTVEYLVKEKLKREATDGNHQGANS